MEPEPYPIWKRSAAPAVVDLFPNRLGRIGWFWLDFLSESKKIFIKEKYLQERIILMKMSMLFIDNDSYKTFNFSFFSLCSVRETKQNQTWWLKSQEFTFIIYISIKYNELDSIQVIINLLFFYSSFIYFDEWWTNQTIITSCFLYFICLKDVRINIWIMRRINDDNEILWRLIYWWWCFHLFVRRHDLLIWKFE